MDDILAKSIIEKVETQENKIAEIQGTLKNLSKNSEGYEQIMEDLQTIKSLVAHVSFPVKEMRELSQGMIEVRGQLNRPTINTVQHHHHFPKMIWLSIGLFIILTVVSTGWYMTGSTLKDYISNDTKYRYLKVFGNNSLKEILFTTDSIHRVEPAMRDSVIQKEEENRQVYELLERAKSKEIEAEKLKRKAGQLQ